MISKELLSEVLEVSEVLRIYDAMDDDAPNFSDNEIVIECLPLSFLNYNELDDDENQAINIVINIYELTHKCKEWAFNNSFCIMSGILNHSKTKIAVIENINIFTPKISFTANTEHESIFKACEWIMEQTK